MRIRTKLEKLEKKIQPLIQSKSENHWSEFLTRLTVKQLNKLHNFVVEGKNYEAAAFVKEIKKEWQAEI